MYLAIKAGAYLHPSMGIYERLDVAVAFAAKALQYERDSYHSYHLYSVTPEEAVTAKEEIRVLTNTYGKIVVDKYVDGVLECSSYYVEEGL